MPKGIALFSLFEPLILYFVLFFPGVFAQEAPAAQPPFSPAAELSYLCFYTLPALALLWYLILVKKSLLGAAWLKPRPRDAAVLAAGFSGLVLLGLITAFAAAKFGGSVHFPEVSAPVSAAGWITLSLSCMGTGYLEETFFRFYFYEKLEPLLHSELARAALQAFLFAACHLYEGPWGTFNAFSAGLFLSLLYIKLRTLNGIACAHGVYNFFVYFHASF
ncbi:MAG: CPBP family intramembrane metalloprotease [Treponematales bacterium]